MRGGFRRDRGRHGRDSGAARGSSTSRVVLGVCDSENVISQGRLMSSKLGKSMVEMPEHETCGEVR